MEEKETRTEKPDIAKSYIKEIDYYKNQLDKQSGEILKIQHNTSQVANELSNLRKGYSLLNEIQRELISAKNDDAIFDKLVYKLVTGLQMNKVAIIKKDSNKDSYIISHQLGFSADEANKIHMKRINIAGKFQSGRTALLVNKSTEITPEIEYFRKALFTQYFILMPLIIDDDVVAYIFAGRVDEIKLISPRIDNSYLETIAAIAGFVSAMIYQMQINNELEKIVKKRTIELHKTIEELLKVRLGKKTLTVLFLVTLAIFLGVDAFIDPFIQNHIGNFYIILALKAMLALCIKPIETIMEKYLYAKTRKKKVNLNYV